MNKIPELEGMDKVPEEWERLKEMGIRMDPWIRHPTEGHPESSPPEFGEETSTKQLPLLTFLKGLFTRRKEGPSINLSKHI